MRASQICASLDIADSTLRKYAVEYADYLSPSGAGGNGRHRDYTDHDVRVLKLVNDMKRSNQSEANIEITLASLQSGDWERLPALDESTAAIIPSPASMVAINQDRAVMQKEIDMLREQIADMKAERKNVEELVRKLAEAELMNRLYESGRLKPPAE